jgi:hypothetical protein
VASCFCWRMRGQIRVTIERTPARSRNRPAVPRNRSRSCAARRGLRHRDPDRKDHALRPETLALDRCHRARWNRIARRHRARDAPPSAPRSSRTNAPAPAPRPHARPCPPPRNRSRRESIARAHRVERPRIVRVSSTMAVSNGASCSSADRHSRARGTYAAGDAPERDPRRRTKRGPRRSRHTYGRPAPGGAATTKLHLPQRLDPQRRPQPVPGIGRPRTAGGDQQDTHERTGEQ